MPRPPKTKILNNQPPPPPMEMSRLEEEGSDPANKKLLVETCRIRGGVVFL